MTSFKEHYDSWHSAKATTESTDLVEPWHKSVARLVPRLEGKVLEVGCGRGDFTTWLSLRNKDAEFTGMDFSESAISIAKGKAPNQSNLRFLVADAHQTGFPDCTFDYVLSCECLEHVEFPDKVAREIFRILKPGGRFVLTTENYFNGMLLMWLKSWAFKTPFDSGAGIQPREHFFLYWRVKRLLESAGLLVEHMESNHFQWLMLPRTSPHLLATKDVDSAVLKRLFRPFGRHFLFAGRRADKSRA